MLNGKEGRLLRRNNDKDANMKINILLCDDDKDFLQRISDTVAGQSVPPERPFAQQKARILPR